MNPKPRAPLPSLLAALLVLGSAAFITVSLIRRPATDPPPATGARPPAVATPEPLDMSRPIRVHDCTLYVNPRDPVHSRILFLTGKWEEDQVAFYLGHLKSGGTVVDIGANLGFYTVLGAKAVGPTGRVFAFEPDPESFGLLRKNVEANGFTNVTAEQKALSNAPGRLKLYLSKVNLGDHRLIPMNRPDFVEVDALRLDDYFGSRPPRIDVIKIDTQGAEIMILQGMKETFKHNPDVKMLIEFWPEGLRQFGHEPMQMLDLLRDYGFKFRDIRDGADPLLETSPKVLMERFGISGWANLFCWR